MIGKILTNRIEIFLAEALEYFEKRLKSDIFKLIHFAFVVKVHFFYFCLNSLCFLKGFWGFGSLHSS